MACIFTFLCVPFLHPSPRSARPRLVAAVKPSSQSPPSPPVSFTIRDTHGIPPFLWAATQPHWFIAACLQYQLPCSQRQAGRAWEKEKIIPLLLSSM